MPADGELDGTGHVHRDGLPGYMEAIEAGGEAYDFEWGDHVHQFRLINDKIWFAIFPGPVVQLSPSNAEAAATILNSFYRRAIGFR